MEHFLTNILFLLVVARLLGEILNRFGQPAVVGEILAGIILGPAFLGLVHPSAELSGIAELSVFLILLSAGLEMDFKQVVTAFIGRGLILGAVSFVIPMGAGLLLGLMFGLGASSAVFLALCIAICALPVICRIMENFKLLETPLAQYAIATAVFNDVAALICLGVILSLPAELSFDNFLESFSQTSGKMALFAAIIAGAYFLLAWGGTHTGFIRKGLEKIISIFGKEALFGVIILFVLLIGSLSEALSSHFVIGVFFGGLLLNTEVMGKKLFHSLENTMNSITSGFLAPIFFAFIGLNFSLEAFSRPFFAIAVIGVSMLAKVFAARLAGRWVKLTAIQSLGLGLVLSSRGTMDLVVAEIALDKGFIDRSLFSILVLLGVTTTLLAPIFFRQMVLNQGGAEPEPVKPKPTPNNNPPVPSNETKNNGEV